MKTYSNMSRYCPALMYREDAATNSMKLTLKYDTDKMKQNASSAILTGIQCDFALPLVGQSSRQFTISGNHGDYLEFFDENTNPRREPQPEPQPEPEQHSEYITLTCPYGATPGMTISFQVVALTFSSADDIDSVLQTGQSHGYLESGPRGTHCPRRCIGRPGKSPASRPWCHDQISR